MTDDAPDIPPALTVEEWSARKHTEGIPIAGAITLAPILKPTSIRIEYDGNYRAALVITLPEGQVIEIADVAAIVKLMALGNDVLRLVDDPRAILAKHVRLLQDAATTLDQEILDPDDPKCDVYSQQYDQLLEFADALESMLPPLTNPTRD